MGSLANAEIIGNAGSDAELRYTPNGSAVTSFSVAVNKTGQNRDETEWYRVTVWGKQAEFFANAVHKGTQVYATGRLYVRRYEKDGVQRYSLELSSTEVQLLGSKNNQDDYELVAAGVSADDNDSDSLPF